MENHRSLFLQLIKREKPCKFLGLDVGKRTIGVAVFNNSVNVSLPSFTLQRQNMERDVFQIVLCIRDREIDGVVVGIPETDPDIMKKSHGYILEFVKKLEDKLDIPVALHDERFTTSLAHTLLKQFNVSRINRDKVDNEVAASLILDGFISKLKSCDKSSV